jgi:hypothetical protein
MDGAKVLESKPVAKVPPFWSIVGIGDYNGETDLLWRDAGGDTAIWLMNGTTILSTAILGNIPTTSTVVGTGIQWRR